jgi:hypothetical protein
MPNNTMNANSPDLFVGESEPKIRDGIVKQVIKEKGEKMETKDVATQGTDINSLMALAVKMGKDGVEVFKQLVDMKREEDMLQAKREFDLQFAKMQKEFSIIYKTKDVMNKDKTKILWAYCPLENIIDVIRPVLDNYDFSYSWSKESIDDWKKVRTWCIVTGYGFEKRVYVDMPIEGQSDFNTPEQQVGKSGGYGKRQSFIDAFGIVISGEDIEQKKKQDEIKTAADKEFNNILTYALKEKIGVYKNTWDTSDESEKRMVYKNIRQDIFDKLVESMEPDRVKSYRELWNKPGNKNQDYIDILEGIKAVKQ